MKNFLLLLLFLTSCAHDKTNDNEKRASDLAPRYAEFVARLEGFKSNGWIVSLDAEGKPEHQGDSLIWTGIAMAALPCDEAQVIADHLSAVMLKHGGALVRFEPLGEYAGGREVTFDGASGLYYGILNNILDCSNHEFWKPAWRKHMGYVAENKGKLNAVAKDNATVIAEFTVLPDYISFLIGDNGRPQPERAAVLEVGVAVWAAAVVATESPCFRVHLGWLYLDALQTLGASTGTGKASYCGATTATDIPLIDHWCGRKFMGDWLDNYQPNVWEYQHQRCLWESPDGKDNTSPAVDFLIGYKVFKR